VSYEYYLVK